MNNNYGDAVIRIDESLQAINTRSCDLEKRIDERMDEKSASIAVEFLT